MSTEPPQSHENRPAEEIGPETAGPLEAARSRRSVSYGALCGAAALALLVWLLCSPRG